MVPQRFQAVFRRANNSCDQYDYLHKLTMPNDLYNNIILSPPLQCRPSLSSSFRAVPRKRRNVHSVMWIERGCILIWAILLFGRSYSGTKLWALPFLLLFFPSWRIGFRYCSLQAAKICYWNLQQAQATSRLFLCGFGPRANLSSEIFVPVPGSAKQAISLLL